MSAGGALAGPLRSLSLMTMAREHEAILVRAEAENWGYRRFLRFVVENEVHERFRRRSERQLKEAGLPPGKPIATLKEQKLRDKMRRPLPTLRTGELIRRGSRRRRARRARLHPARRPSAVHRGRETPARSPRADFTDRRGAAVARTFMGVKHDAVSQRSRRGIETRAHTMERRRTKFLAHRDRLESRTCGVEIPFASSASRPEDSPPPNFTGASPIRAA